mgnify:CR=1 FL=1
MIDLDPQGNASSGLGVEKDALEFTVYQLMIGMNSFDECVQRNVSRIFSRSLSHLLYLYYEPLKIWLIRQLYQRTNLTI